MSFFGFHGSFFVLAKRILNMEVADMAKEQKKTKGSKPRYMTTYEAAELLGLSAGTLRVWRCQGQGPSYYKVGNAVRYKVDDLEAWKSANVKRIEGYRQKSV